MSAIEANGGRMIERVRVALLARAEGLDVMLDDGPYASLDEATKSLRIVLIGRIGYEGAHLQRVGRTHI